MNRQERRRRQRKTPVIVAGDNVVMAGVGPHYEARPRRELPEKVPGKHRWIATAVWVIGEPMVETMEDPDTMKFLDAENIMELGVMCWDCEMPLGMIKPGGYCPAPASG